MEIDFIQCTQCNSGWELASSEKFCGWCGAALESATCLVDGDQQLLYWDLLKEHPIRIEILNTGIKEVYISGLDIKTE